MLNEKVGTVTEMEKDEILGLYERKLALQELAITLNNPEFDENSMNKLYEKIVSDLGRTNVYFEQWWKEKSSKYQWEFIEGYEWSIDFKTCEIYLNKKDSCCS
ncbi:CXXX repeat peptide modification system protein [Clostridium felsineum]|uniref:Uncharacterized protein n=1 Tax=Clostridium felsineum TaxID=36839 RepID=A0A1S8L9K6_9CLOT|nr:CXXX repeat peptide modification system protein [Clostridium felsineum]URZ05983.1 hypothetical protein CLROS_013150 [Clostridium felsineum]URZ11020.1 hypothetical protein CROST_017360 [Clostridium felsineum]